MDIKKSKFKKKTKLQKKLHLFFNIVFLSLIVIKVVLIKLIF